MRRIYGRAKRPDLRNIRAFESRTEVWQEVGLGGEIDRGDARRARREAIVLLALIIGVLVVFAERDALLPDVGKPLRYITAGVLALLGWLLARTIARGLAPQLFRRLQPGTAGTTGFLIRLATIAIVVITALRIAGVKPETLAVGGAFTAVVLGLAAQQTFGNLFAGLVLLSARPFRVGDLVRLQGGGLAGEIEGVVSSLGLLYTVFSNGDDQIMVPNNVVLSVAVIPLREPSGVDLRARLRAGVTPVDIQILLEKTIETPMRDKPRVALEEIDGDETVVRIGVSPIDPTQGGRLSSEVLQALVNETRRAEAA